MRSFSLATVGAIATAMTLAGCGGDSGSAAGDEAGTTIVASFYPLAYVAERVGGEHVDVDNLTSPGVDPHDLELAPKQVAEVQEADLAIYETGFQPAVDEAVEQAELPDDASLDVTDVVTLIDGAEHDEHGSDHEGHDHGDDHEGHDHDHEHDHEHSGPDPHVWLDPTNMIAIAESVRDRLSEADPDNAKAYAANAKEFTAQLRQLDQAYRSGLAKCERNTIVTSHDAFGYLAQRYGLEQIGIAGLDPSSEPSSAEMADITDLVREDGITTVFTEELVSPAIAETVAESSGAEVATLDPIEGLGEDTADETYLSLMRKNLAALKEANGCS